MSGLTPVGQVMIGPEERAWDLAAIMFFPTRSAFAKILSDPEFQHASRHRKAAFAIHCMVHLAGDPCTQRRQIDPGAAALGLTCP